MKIINRIVNGFTQKYEYPNLFKVMTEFIELRNMLYEKKASELGLTLEPDTVVKVDIKKTWTEDQVVMALTAKTIGEMVQVIDDNAYELEINEEDAIRIYDNAFIELAKGISNYDAFCFGKQADLVTAVNDAFKKIVYKGDKACHVMIYVAEELDMDSYDDIKILQHIRHHFDEVMANYTKYESEVSSNE